MDKIDRKAVKVLSNQTKKFNKVLEKRLSYDIISIEERKILTSNLLKIIDAITKVMKNDIFCLKDVIEITGHKNINNISSQMYDLSDLCICEYLKGSKTKYKLLRINMRKDGIPLSMKEKKFLKDIERIWFSTGYFNMEEIVLKLGHTDVWIYQKFRVMRFAGYVELVNYRKSRPSLVLIRRSDGSLIEKRTFPPENLISPVRIIKVDNGII